MPDLAQILKLRLVVARFGEMDGAGWWNTQGILGPKGKSVMARGFPMSHHFAQARIACSVAAARSAEVFSPPGCFTLWSLPAEMEDAIICQWPVWCRSPQEWTSFFEDLERRNRGSLLQHLTDLDLIDEATTEALGTLKRTAEGKAVPLPGVGSADLPTLKLLAAAFSKGERGAPAIPYIRAA